MQMDSITYPVLTLPPEIISEIFIHCLPARRKVDVVNPTEAPLLLTRVCGLWRQIAISTPELWAAFDLEIGWPEPNLQQIGQTWLERARDRPLSVKLSSCGILQDINYVDRFMQTLWGHANDIQALELDISVEDFDVVDMPFQSSGFPMLRKFSVRLQEGLGGLVTNYWPMKMFKDAPMLCEVALGGSPPSLVILPWQQLTKFTAELYTVAESLEALRLMPNLTHCALAAFDLPSSPSSPTSFFPLMNVAAEHDLKPITHPRMRHLTLFNSKSDRVLANSADVLAFLTLPALETLEIRGVKDFDGVVLDSVLSRSSPPLRKLSILPLDSGPQKRTGTDLYLPSLPSLCLTEMEIRNPSTSFLSAFFTALFGHDNAFPQLRNISFLGCGDLGAVLPLAAMNVHPGPPAKYEVAVVKQLQSLRVISEFIGTCREQDLLPFRQLKTAGVAVYIGTEEKSLV
ncbi:hypothetical protein C8R47DRAFT_301112 [Mycena vitilis]|nr:hypothetical protein C8R47DRAFT_301112 [Mycena vitilis]